jgi:hypothetical protein
MNSIADYIGTTFEPEAVKVISDAYAAVLRELHDRGQPDVVREVIAKRVIELATIGERDPQRLCSTVLDEFGLNRD